MTKEEIVAEQKAKILADQDLALAVGLEAAVDGGIVIGVASVPPPEADVQAQIDAAVAPLNAKIAQDASDLAALHAQADADLASAKQALDDMSAKEQLEEGEVAALKAKIDSIRALLG